MPSDYQLDGYIECNDIAKQHIIYHSGSSANGFYYVEQGLVGLYQVTENGKETLLRIYGPDSYFGYRSLFTHQRYPSTARAMLDSKITYIDVQDFASLQALSPELSNCLIREVCEELGDAEKRLMQFNSYNAKKRILDTIYYIFHTYPEYPWTYREIGEYSGTDTTTVIRYCKTLKQAGLLQANSRKPMPVDLEQLSLYRRSLITD